MELTNEHAQPSQAKSNNFLQARIRHLLQKADAESHPKKRFQSLELARDLSRKLRRHEGAGAWWPIAFAVGMCLVFAYVAQKRSARDYTYSAPDDVFQILARQDAYRYQFNHIHSENGRRVYSDPQSVTFCPNYEPQLSAGQTIRWLRYMDLGRCWDIQPEGYGYVLERRGGLPTLAPNCFVNDRDVTECKPNFTEAIFEKGK